MFMSGFDKGHELRDYMRELNFINLILRAASFSMMTVLTVDIIVVSFFYNSLAFFRKFEYRSSGFELNDANVFIVYFISFIGFLCLFIFNHFRSKGNVLFEVITEEVEWNFKNTDEKKPERQPVEFRLALKNFLKSSDLPFAPGNLGLIIYFIMFIGMIILKTIKFNVIGN